MEEDFSDADLAQLTTEAPDSGAHLDSLDALGIVSAINDADATVAAAVREERHQIARAVEGISAALTRGGRLVYLGCGTSGRLGVLDASECPVTFGVSAESVVGVIGGGREAVTASREGVEDDPEQGAKDLKGIELKVQDVVVGISASGRTPYVLGGLKYAKSAGCSTIGVACNKGSRMEPAVDVMIAPETGPEVLAGSTRMKGGTATKMVLNMLSTGAMVLQGRIFEGRMVALNARACHKLRLRAKRILLDLGPATPEVANSALLEADWDVRLALLRIRKPALGLEEAKELLEQCGGNLGKALNMSVTKL